MDMLFAYIDGASKGNPGRAGIGIIIKDKSGGKLKEISTYIGVATNNYAEYQGLLAALKAMRRLGIRKACVFSDSELLVRQFNGIYKVRNPKLKSLYNRVMKEAGFYKSLEIRFLPRHKNKEADKLANLAIKKIGK